MAWQQLISMRAKTSINIIIQYSKGFDSFLIHLNLFQVFSGENNGSGARWIGRRSFHKISYHLQEMVDSRRDSRWQREYSKFICGTSETEENSMVIVWSMTVFHSSFGSIYNFYCLVQHKHQLRTILTGRRRRIHNHRQLRSNVGQKVFAGATDSSTSNIWTKFDELRGAT